MTSLFIFFVHGGPLAAKMVTKQTLSIESMITLCVFHDGSSHQLIISGSPIISDYMANKDKWFRPPKEVDNLAEFKQLFDQLKRKYKFEREDIFTSFEGNWTNQQWPYITPIVVDGINYVKPAYTFLPSGTLACCKFVNYWIDFHLYPRFDLGETLNLERDYYQEDELTHAKKIELDTIAHSMPLTCNQPPLLATFDKANIGKAISVLLSFSATTQSVAHPEKMDRLPNGMRREAFVRFHAETDPGSRKRVKEDNQIYPFAPKDDQENITIAEYTTQEGEPYQHTLSNSSDASKISSGLQSRETVSWGSGRSSLRFQYYRSGTEQYFSNNGHALVDPLSGTTGNNSLDQIVALKETQVEQRPPVSESFIENNETSQDIRLKPARGHTSPARTWLQFFAACCTCRCICDDASSVNSRYISTK